MSGPIAWIRGLIRCYPISRDIGKVRYSRRVESHLSDFLGEFRENGIHHRGVKSMRCTTSTVRDVLFRQELLDFFQRFVATGENGKLRAIMGSEIKPIVQERFHS